MFQNSPSLGDKIDDKASEAGVSVRAAIEILEQGESLLRRLGTSDYTHVHDCAFSATIGEHYRHCLDHFSSFLGGVQTGVVDYDARERDGMIETSLEFAIQVTTQIKEQLIGLDAACLKSRCETVCKVSYRDPESPRCESSFSRELVYVIAHAIHHYALISIICSVAKIKLPDDFGVAPSTVAHQVAQQG